MIVKPLFRRHYFTSLLIIVVGILVSLLISIMITSAERKRFFHSPARFVKRLVLQTGQPPADAVRTVADLTREDFPFNIEYLAPDSPEITTLSAAELNQLKTAGHVLEGESLRPGPPVKELVSLGDGQGFIKMTPRSGIDPGPKPLLMTVIGLFLSVTITTGLAIFVLFRSYRTRAEAAKGILSELKSGNLSARMPVLAMDELSELVVSFNHMADEIQKLISRIQRSETARMQMLQSLAHDLRTPIASLKTFLESLRDDRHRMSEEQMQRSISLCIIENLYFERLVEDLLILASIADPRYSKNIDHLKPTDFLATLIGGFTAKYPAVETSFKTDVVDGPPLPGDRRLLERLLRNGLENAYSFAHKKVLVELSVQNNEYLIRISDDGPGLDATTLREFGHKRQSRKVLENHGTRISSGIGSVIMKEVALIHDGSVVIENIVDGHGQNLGARLTILLPFG